MLVRGGTLVLTGGASGGERVLVTMPGGGEAGHPAVSPDGGRVAFTYRSGTYGVTDWGADLHVLDLPREGQPPAPARLLLKHARPGDMVEGLSWSPDGRSLVLAYQEARYDGDVYQGTRPRLERLDLVTGGRSVVVENAREPSWSPRGERIAYVRVDPRTGSQTIWTASPDGSGAEQLTGPGEYTNLQSPRYSPDGSSLVFAAVPGSASGSGATRPGGWLSYLRPPVAEAHGVPWDLWMWREGEAPRQITRLGEDQPHAAWSPRGDSIALITDVALYTVSPTGEGVRRVRAEADPRGLAWTGR